MATTVAPDTDIETNGHETTDLTTTVVISLVGAPALRAPTSAQDQDMRRCIVTTDPALIEAREPYLGPWP